MNTQLVSHPHFISRYRGENDYGVYVRRLGRDVRVCMNEAGGIKESYDDQTPDEWQACIEAVREFLADEHTKYLAWREKNASWLLPIPR